MNSDSDIFRFNFITTTMSLRVAIYGSSRARHLNKHSFRGMGAPKIRYFKGKSWRFLAAQAVHELKKYKRRFIVYLIGGWCDMTLKTYSGRIILDPSATYDNLMRKAK